MRNSSTRSYFKAIKIHSVSMLCAIVLASMACDKKKEKVTEAPQPPGKEKSNGDGTASSPKPPGLNIGGSGGGSSSSDHSNYQNLTAEEVLGEMLRTPEIYAPVLATGQFQQFSGFTATDPLSACMQQGLRQVPVQANKTSIAIAFEANATNCANSVPDSNLKFLAATLHVELITTCEGDDIDLSEADGKLLDEIDTSVFERCTRWGDAMLLKHAARLERARKDSSGSVRNEVLSLGGIQYRGTNDQKPCAFSTKNDLAQQDNVCINYLRQDLADVVIDGQAEPKMSVTFEKRFDQQGLQYLADGSEKWYRSGTTAFLVNDWKGTFSYTDGHTPPNYELQRGKEKLSGSLQDTNFDFLDAAFNETASLPTANRLIELQPLRSR